MSHGAAGPAAPRPCKTKSTFRPARLPWSHPPGKARLPAVLVRSQATALRRGTPGTPRHMQISGRPRVTDHNDSFFTKKARPRMPASPPWPGPGTPVLIRKLPKATRGVNQSTFFACARRRRPRATACGQPGQAYEKEKGTSRDGRRPRWRAIPCRCGWNGRGYARGPCSIRKAAATGFPGIWRRTAGPAQCR